MAQSWLGAKRQKGRLEFTLAHAMGKSAWIRCTDSFYLGCVTLITTLLALLVEKLAVQADMSWLASAMRKLLPPL
jgi:hypothetical protein